MTDHDKELTPTLEETARRRADLHHALVEVEKAISGPPQRPEGLYDEITQRAPRLSTKIVRLREEHPSMRDGTIAAIAKLQTTGVGDAWPLNEARDDLQRLLGKIVRHRQLGADLVWEAYNLDIGGVE